MSSFSCAGSDKGRGMFPDPCRVALFDENHALEGLGVWQGMHKGAHAYHSSRKVTRRPRHCLPAKTMRTHG